MNCLFVLFFCLALVHASSAFHQPGFGLSSSMNRFVKRTSAMTQLESGVGSKSAVAVEEEIPEQLRGHKCLYDMILVERLTLPETTKSGLHIPKPAQDEQRLARVVAMPKGYGVESVGGNVVPIEVLAPFNAGDVVYVKVRPASEWLLWNLF